MHTRENQRNGATEASRPIEILYCIDSLLGVGGAELSLARIIQALPRDRYRARVVTFHALKAGCELIENSGAPVYHWPLVNPFHPTTLGFARRIWKMVRDERIDIVHTFFHTSDLWTAPLAKLAGVRFLISSRRDMGILRQRKHLFGYRLMRSLFDQVQTVSESVRRYTIDVDGVDPSRVVTIYNGVKEEDPTPVSAAEAAAVRASAGIEPNQILVSTVANLRHVKGLDTLVRAAAIVAARAPEVRFLVAGSFGVSPVDVAYSNGVLRLAAELGVDRVIQFLGGTQHVRPLLEASDVFALPSRSEGLSNALLEAMHSGLPCVATLVGGNPEVVDGGVTGFLVPSDDPEALADRIVDLARDRQKRVRMGVAARERVRVHFGADTMTSTVIRSYDHAMELRPPAAQQTKAAVALGEDEG
jgi:L-malate glycosyltransferase